MPEVIFTGPSGRLEGRYQPAKKKNAPIAIVLHPHPQFGGTMNNQIVYNLFYDFVDRGFSVLPLQLPRSRPVAGQFRPWFGGVVRCGCGARLGPDHEPGCARLLDCRRQVFGAWIGMQVADAPPGNRGLHLHRRHGQSLRLSPSSPPCPSSGLFVHGSEDRVSPVKEVMSVIEKVKTQKGIKIEHTVVDGANHFFDGKVDDLMTQVGTYLDGRLGPKDPASREQRHQVMSPRLNRHSLRTSPKPRPPMMSRCRTRRNRAADHQPRDICEKAGRRGRFFSFRLTEREFPDRQGPVERGATAEHRGCQAHAPHPVKREGARIHVRADA